MHGGVILTLEVNNNQGQGHLKECMTHDRINFEVNININSRLKD